MFPTTGPFSVGPEAHGVVFWGHVEKTIDDRISERFGARHPRMLSMNVPLIGETPPNPGTFLGSAGIAFNCRVVGYQIWTLFPGSLSVDIQMSDINTHPEATFNDTPLLFVSLINGGMPTLGVDPAVPDPISQNYSWNGQTTSGEVPALNGAFADSFGEATDPLLSWAIRDLNVGSMLHFWCVNTDGITKNTTMMLYLQDLDEFINTGG